MQLIFFLIEHVLSQRAQVDRKKWMSSLAELSWYSALKLEIVKIELSKER